MKSTDIYNDLGKFSLSTHSHTWNDISSRPSTFPPSEHTHTDYAPIDQIIYTSIDPGENTTSSLPDNTLICVYEEEEVSS